MKDSPDILSGSMEPRLCGRIVLNADFRITEVSDGEKFAVLFPEAVLGQEFAEAARLLWHETFAGELSDACQRALETGREFRLTGKLLTNVDSAEIVDVDVVCEHHVLGDGTRGVTCSFYESVNKAKGRDNSRRELPEWSVLDSMSMQIALLDRDGTIVAVNETWRQFAADNSGDDPSIHENTGVGVNYLEVCRTSTGVDADEAADVLDGIEAVLAGRVDRFEIEYPCHSPTELRWFLLSCAAIRGSAGGAVVSHLDISSRKLAEEKLRLSEENQRSFAPGAPIPIWIYDPETFRILEANEAATRVYGYSHAEFTAMTIRDLWLADFEPDLNLTSVRHRENAHLAGNWRHVKKDGAVIDVEVGSSAIEYWGENAGMLIAQDVTERTRSIELLRKSEARYRLLFEDNPSPMIIYDFDSLRFLDVNEATCLHYGYTREEMLGMKLSDFGSPADIATIRKTVRRNNERRTVYGAWKHRRKDGSEIWVETASHKLEIEGENSRIVIINDVTDKVRAEENFHEAEGRFRATFEKAAVGIAHIALDGRWLLANQRLSEITGYSGDELAERTLYDLLHPDDVEHGKSLLTEIVSGEIEVYAKEKRYVRKDGKVIWIHKSVSLVRDDDGFPKYLLSVIEDISQRKAAEEELTKWAAAFENCAHGIVLGDPKTNRVFAVNSAFAQLCGKSKVEIEGQSILSIYDPEYRENVKATIEISDRDGSSRHFSVIRNADGGKTHVQVDVVSVRNLDGEVCYRVATIQDITARLEAENALRESEGKLRLFIESAPAAVAMFDREMRYLAVSGRWIQDYRLDGDVVGRNHYDVFPELEDRLKQVHIRALAGATEKADEDIFVRQDGTVQMLRWEARPWSDSSGEIGGIIILSEDVTERVNTREELRRSEEKLHQAQKMEEFGRLAGGIAHDFNNMLTVIKGYSDMGLRMLPPGNTVRNFIEEIRKAGERSSSLTHQLLAFSRRQIVQPEILSVNDAVGETLKMLKYVLGEDIRIRLELSDDVGSILADPGHVSQILMNLLVNARDAMPGGGSVTITTSRIVRTKIDLATDEPEDFVVLEVRDTGTGMDEETLGKIFEPFFTTKSVGKGTGLGLATVYGIVKQAHGEIEVSSVPGEGTVFRILFPHVSEDEPGSEVDEYTREFPRGEGTILVVEDEELVRDLTKVALEACGYRVIVATNGIEGLKICEKPDVVVDLLVTDIVMPEMGGLELFEKLSSSQTAMPRFLFMSGYFDDNRLQNTRVRIGDNFIQKPFQMNDFIEKVRQILSSS